MLVHSISLIGKRPSNEDQHDIILNIDNSNSTKKQLNFFAVYDGHGGKKVSRYLKNNLSQYFTGKNIEYNPTHTNYKKYIERVFDHIQNKLVIECKNFAEHVGSTALIVIQYPNGKGKSSCYIANIGDCRAIKCNRNNIALQLTKDHKPNTPGEKYRIENMGGTITYDGYDHRIMGLSLSRAFGDLDARPYVIHNPNIFKSDVLKSDKFMVIACDGLWDVLSNQHVINFINSKYSTINNKKINIARLLANYAIKKGTTDNVTVIIVFF
jgi:serine/threonine protein phosphatase PrpC